MTDEKLAFKRIDKYLVLKWDDLRKYLTDDLFMEFDAIAYICELVREGRRKDGKKDNKYVVVNEDEPYAEDVWMLIEKGGSLESLGYFLIGEVKTKNPYFEYLTAYPDGEHIPNEQHSAWNEGYSSGIATRFVEAQLEGLTDKEIARALESTGIYGKKANLEDAIDKQDRAIVKALLSKLQQGGTLYRRKI